MAGNAEIRPAARGKEKAPRPRDEGLLFVETVSGPHRGKDAEGAV